MSNGPNRILNNAIELKKNIENAPMEEQKKINKIIVEIKKTLETAEEGSTSNEEIPAPPVRKGMFDGLFKKSKRVSKSAEEQAPAASKTNKGPNPTNEATPQTPGNTSPQPNEAEQAPPEEQEPASPPPQPTTPAENEAKSERVKNAEPASPAASAAPTPTQESTPAGNGAQGNTTTTPNGAKLGTGTVRERAKEWDNFIKKRKKSVGGKKTRKLKLKKTLKRRKNSKRKSKRR